MNVDLEKDLTGQNCRPWSEVYNFFMLYSAEHEILNAQEYKNIKKFSFFSGS